MINTADTLSPWASDSAPVSSTAQPPILRAPRQAVQTWDDAQTSALYPITDTSNEWGSTARRSVNRDLYYTVTLAIHGAFAENFENGIESELSREIIPLIERHGEQAIEPLAHLLVYEVAQPETAAEVLRWLGRIRNQATHGYRRWLLERCLLCSSTAVRDAAALGLVSLRDAHAMKYLRAAIAAERNAELREDLQQAADALESVVVP